LEAIEAIYRREAPYILATLIRLLGSFELAEEAMQNAFLAAAAQWQTRGVPANPRAWLISAGRFRTIDSLRKRSRFSEIAPELAVILDAAEEREEDHAMPDDMLRLIFTCCHPALPTDAQSALCLREVCGLTTEEIAAAFLSKPATIAQRIVRAKARIREEQIDYTVPEGDELTERLDHVARVIYLMFSEGYSASSGDSLIRTELMNEAIRLGRLVHALLKRADVAGLLGLMLLQNSRQRARLDERGDIVLLPDQDRTLWDQQAIREGLHYVDEALAQPPYASFTLQAAIAAVHARSGIAEITDWARIVWFYDLLVVADPGPIVEFNRAIAIGMRDGPEAGLQAIERILQRGELADYKFVHFARADFLIRLGDKEAARAAYGRAAAMPLLRQEERFVERRLAELD
jgi:RNA polymerase sigma-70 factor (ECF subfamily)